MSSDFIEYEFTLADGTKRYEMVDRHELKEAFAFQRYHSAISFKPVERKED